MILTFLPGLKIRHSPLVNSSPSRYAGCLSHVAQGRESGLVIRDS